MSNSVRILHWNNFPLTSSRIGIRFMYSWNNVGYYFFASLRWNWHVLDCKWIFWKSSFSHMTFFIIAVFFLIGWRHSILRIALAHIFIHKIALLSCQGFLRLNLFGWLRLEFRRNHYCLTDLEHKCVRANSSCELHGKARNYDWCLAVSHYRDVLVFNLGTYGDLLAMELPS